MATIEPVVVDDGWTLVKEGMDSATLRDLHRRRYWRGLSGDEAYLLGRWVDQQGGAVGELHTDVPVGQSPYDGLHESHPALRNYLAKLYPLRIDAVACVAGVWHVIEVKAHAGYVALGQVLTYGFYAVRTIERLRECRLSVVTDQVQGCIRPVFGHFGVVVFAVGGEVAESYP